jgi:4-amino-4-deoxy-L-arabinose transferase-like glycosyltransferase
MLSTWLLRSGLLAAALLIWFSNLDYRKLIKPDEGRYAEISREMAVTGDWVTPRLNGIKYFEKPPLQYWAGAAAIDQFGAKEWTARLWTAITGVLGILLAWFTGVRLFGERAGAFAAVVLGSSLMYVALGHLNTLDMGLTFFLFAALCAFLLAHRDIAGDRANAIWMHVAWAAMAGAVLSKGLIGIVIPAATLVLYSIAQRDLQIWRRLHLITGLILFLAICAPWFVLVSLRNPEFPWFFFIHEHFLRFTTKIHQRVEPWFYFIPLFIAGGLPWLVVMVDALWRGALPEARAGFHVRRFLLIWCVFVFVFFSASGSKLPPYILPLFPAAALLTGWRLTSISGKVLAWMIAPMALVGAAGLLALPFVHGSGDTPVELIGNYKLWLAAAALLGLGAAVGGIQLARRERIGAAVTLVGFGALVSFQLALTGHESLSPSMSAYHIAQQVKPHLRPNMAFYSVNGYDQTLDFYLGRTVTLVQFRDELDYGLQQEPQLAIDTVSDWMRTWSQQKYALALLDKGMYERLSAGGLPMELIAHDARRYVVKKP